MGHSVGSIMPFVRAGDITIHYHTDGSGLPLMLLMGLGCPGELWFNQIPEFSRSFRVITIDNRGVGLTDKPDMEYTVPLCADDTANLLHALGVDRAHVLGMSMGEAIAQELALRHPQMVEKLVLSCTFSEAVGYGRDLLESWRRTAQGAGMEALAQLEVLQSLMPRAWARQPELVPKLKAMFALQPMEAYLRQNWACVSHKTSDRLHQIQAPTLVLVGSHDVQTPIGGNKFLADRIPNSRFVVLERLGHGFMWEAPEQYNKVVLDFLLDRE